jgi:ketosteroid isomerase-like protein
MTTSRDEAIRGFAERFIGAWNSQDVDSVLAIYADDLAYRDPNTRGAVSGKDALRRYLRRLFAEWTMHWSLREAYPLLDGGGAAVLWRASFRRGSGPTVEAEGVDLVLVRGEHIARNDVYFDRSVLAPLMDAPRTSGG